jgi:glyceraldehyde-3-phosphate dehydrogenase [NAD(P)+]
MKITKLKLGRFFDSIYEMGKDEIPVFKIFIDGKWVNSSQKKTFDVDTPFDGSLLAKAQQSSIEDVKKAVDAAYNNRQSIRDIPGIDRVKLFEKARSILLEHEDEFSNTLMLEAGKSKKDALGEVEAAAERMKLTLEEARKIYGEYIPGDWSDYTVGKIALAIREPLGVIATITPFNYPLFISSAKIVPAILAGNSVVAKGASEDPLVLLMLARVLEAAGLPPGVLNVLTGAGKDVGDALVSDGKIGMITFTGSTEVGKHITSIAGLKRLHLELGGKGMAVVLEDADIELAAKKCVDGCLKYAGQRCDAVSIIAVAETVADKFLKEVIKAVDLWKVGDPRKTEVDMGPVINEGAIKKIDSLVKDAVSNGAVLVKGGNSKGCFYEPTIIDKVPLTARIAWEEIFGPVVAIIRVKNEDEALEIAAKSKYGLDSCVFTNNFYKMWKVAKRLKVGEVTINDLPRHGVGFFPFGGVKDSGFGREGIGYSIDEMTDLKTIVFNLEPAKLGKPKRIQEM